MIPMFVDTWKCQYGIGFAYVYLWRSRNVQDRNKFNCCAVSFGRDVQYTKLSASFFFFLTICK